MVRRQRKKLPRISRLFKKAVRYLECNNQRRLFDLLRREPELLNYLEEEQTLLSSQVIYRRMVNIDIVEQLLRMGADPDLVVEGATTPLIQAATNNNVRLVRLLLDFGADIEKPNEQFETPLGYACTWDAIEVVQLLCERGANVNGTEGWGFSYLFDVQGGVQRDGPDSKQAQIERILLSFGARAIREEPKLRWDEQNCHAYRVDTGQQVY